LKGECTVFPLTADAGAVFAPGRSVWVTALDGGVLAGPLEIERSRPYHREWLIAFRGHGARSAVEGWTDGFLSVPESELRPPEGNEVYVHELEGFAVRTRDGSALGVVTGIYQLPAGLTLEVQGAKREFLLPFRKQFVREVDRGGRRLVVELPEGLAELGGGDRG
jgi:16S rRNA processing protein RimM